MTTTSDKLSKVPEVDIDPKGRFKYILIKVYATNDPASSPSKEQFRHVVRGYGDCPYHGKVKVLAYLEWVQLPKLSK